MSDETASQEPTWDVQSMLAQRGVTSTVVLNRLLEILGMTKDVELARYLSVSKATISTWRSRNKIPYDVILLEYLEKKIDIIYCLTGDKFSALSGYPGYHSRLELAGMVTELNRRFGSPDKWRLEPGKPSPRPKPDQDDGAQ